MKIGIAKIDAGYDAANRFQPVDPTDGHTIKEGHKYLLPDGYDFAFEGAIFKADEGPSGDEKTKTKKGAN